VLGQFTVTIDDRKPLAAAGWHRPSADLVKMLAIAPAHRLPPDVAIERLWPELPAERGRANLRKAVHFARRALGNEQAIETRGDVVALWPAAGITVDAARFEAMARAAVATKDTTIAHDAARLYTGELLPDDRYAAWTDTPRRRLTELAVAVHKLAGQWQGALEIDPLDEEANRGLMHDHLHGGNRQAAVQQFERLRSALHEELGVSPEPETVAVYEEALTPARTDAPTPAQRARALLAWGMVHWERRDFDEAERTARETWALAVDAGLGAELGEASALLGMIAQARGQWRGFFRDELVGSLHSAPLLAPFVFDANVCLSEFCLFLPGALPEMAAFADEVDRAAAETGSLQGHALASLVRGEVGLLAGDLAGSERALIEASTPRHGPEEFSATPLAMARLAEAWTWSGQRWKARRIARRALPLALAGPLAAHLVPCVYKALVESAASAADAAATVHEAERAMSGLEVCRSCSMGFRTSSARRLAEAADTRSAAVHLDEAEQIASMWPGGPWAAAVREARAAIARAGDRPAEATTLSTEAAELFAEFGFALHAARSRAAVEKAGPQRRVDFVPAGNASGTGAP
jgi:DNA-binding SARP family transcriptional activator